MFNKEYHLHLTTTIGKTLFVFYNNDQLEIFAPFEMSKIDMASLSVEDRQSGREIPQDTLAPTNYIVWM